MRVEKNTIANRRFAQWRFKYFFDSMVQVSYVDPCLRQDENS
jgi:hypothetical protein